MLGKDKLNTIEVLISKALIDSYISHDEFVSVNNVLRKYYEVRKEIKILKLLWNTLYKKHGKLLCHLQKIYCQHCSYQIVLLVARKSQLLLKVKNFQTIIVFFS